MIKINRILEVEKHLEGIEGIVFDLDDTLYSEKDYVRSGYQAIADHFPQVSKMAEKLWQVFEKGGQAIDEVFVNEGLLDEKAKALQIYRLHTPKIQLYPGVREMLCRLRASEKKIGLITDGRPEGQRAKIESLQLSPLMDKIIITDELGGIEFRKPNEKAFLMMQEFMNLPYQKMVYIGDNPKKDFAAPDKLCMHSIYFVNCEGLYYH